MPTPLRAETMTRVKASAPDVAQVATDITKAMYARLFRDAHIRDLFNHANQGESGSQVHALAAAIVGYAQHIDNLEPIQPMIERIAHKHIGYHILPEHYPFVARALLGAIAEVLGEAATPELLAAWEEAYWFLADLLKDREAEIRHVIEEQRGGWNGWRSFVVAEKRPESEVITSFILRPRDGAPVMRHRPGQFLTFRLPLPDGAYAKRNYSISCAPNDEVYRISVKREAQGDGGSRYLHDNVQVGDMLEVTPPAGDFYLPDEPERPVVLLSAGVGLTPMVSMLETVAKQYPDLETHYVHAALNSATHAMDRHVRAIARKHDHISVSTFYSDPMPTDAAGLSHDHDGFITVDWLRDNTRFDASDFYLCGPKPFLRALVNGLSKAGVSRDAIHFEFFGPADELILPA